MPLETTRKTLKAYLDALIDSDDFTQLFTDGVVRTMVDGAETRGHEVVQGLIDYLPTQAFALPIEPENLVLGETGAA